MNFAWAWGFQALSKRKPYILVWIQVNCTAQDAVQVTLLLAMLTDDPVLHSRWKAYAYMKAAASPHKQERSYFDAQSA